MNSSNPELVILNGTIVTANETFKGDVAVKDGRISMIAESLQDLADSLSNVEGVDIIDAQGKYVLPAAIDCHTHLEMEFGGTVSSDDYTSGSRAAICGGVASYIDFVIQRKGESLKDALQRRQVLASAKSCCDYGFHIAITDLNESILEEMEEVVKLGVNSFKVFMVYSFAIDDEIFAKILNRAKAIGARVSVHAENLGLLNMLTEKYIAEGHGNDPYYHYLSRPEFCESEAVARAVHFAKSFDAPLYIVHLACKDGVEEIIKAHEQGFTQIVAETCPQYLAFTSDVYKRPDARNFVCSPPMKGQESQDALWAAINSGQISTVATDHCPFLSTEKDWGKDDFRKIPNGMMGIENMYPFMLSSALQGRITLNKAVAVCSTNVARLFGCSTKGSISVGKDADIVIYNPDTKFTITHDKMHDCCDHSIWEGMELQGYPEMTFVRGKLCFENGKFKGEAGYGKYLVREPLQSVAFQP
ncbi:hypothetical protein RCL1_001150 [Eukaryota sp. TZLM3-RCL]